MSRDEKPNCAIFASEREESLLKSRKNGNPRLRMVPAISSLPVLDPPNPEPEPEPDAEPEPKETVPVTISENVYRGGEITRNSGCLVGGVLMIGCVALLFMQPRRSV